MEQRLRFVREQVAAAEDERAKLGATMLHRATLREVLRSDHRRLAKLFRTCVARAARKVAAQDAPQYNWVGIVRAEVYAALTAAAKGPRRRG